MKRPVSFTKFHPALMEDEDRSTFSPLLSESIKQLSSCLMPKIASSSLCRRLMASSQCRRCISKNANASEAALLAIASSDERAQCCRCTTQERHACCTVGGRQSCILCLSNWSARTQDVRSPHRLRFKTASIDWKHCRMSCRWFGPWSLPTTSDVDL